MRRFLRKNYVYIYDSISPKTLKKQEKFSFNNTFNNNKHIELENNNINDLSIVEYKETILKKIINKIIFHMN